MNHQSPIAQFAERFLTGTVESIARGLAKGAESILGDAKKALQNEASKVELIEKGVEYWRKTQLGEISDLPPSLQDDDPVTVQVQEKKEEKAI